MELKVCNTCKRELPKSSDYFYKFKHGKDGLRASCKECQGGKFILKENLPEGKIRCTDCRELLEETEENFIRYYDKKYSKYRLKKICRKCTALRSKEWRKNNHEKYEEYHQRYRKTDSARLAKIKYRTNNKEKIKKRKKIYRMKNKAKIAEYDKEKWADPVSRNKKQKWTKEWKTKNKKHLTLYMENYYRENKEYFLEKAHIRRQRIAKLPYDFDKADWIRAKEYFGYKCAYCGKQGALTKEHVVPVSKGGGFTVDNIIPACPHCNSSKKNRDLEEWYTNQDYYKKERYTEVIEFLKTKENERL